MKEKDWIIEGQDVYEIVSWTRDFNLLLSTTYMDFINYSSSGLAVPEMAKSMALRLSAARLKVPSAAAAEVWVFSLAVH